jgi:hypothetical protein
MTTDEIATALRRGARNICGVVIDIEQQTNFRWVAKVQFDGGYTEIETIVSHHEGGCYDWYTAFVDHVASEISWMLKKK